MDEPSFSEDITSKHKEDMPYNGDFSQINICNDYNLTSNNDTPDATDQIILTADDTQEKATYKGTCRYTDMAITLNKMPENAVNKNYETETQCTINLHIPANKGDPSKSNISDILLTIFRRRKSQKVKALTVKLSQRSLMLPVLMKLLLKILFCIMLRILGQKNKL